MIQLSIKPRFNPVFKSFNKTKCRYRAGKGSAGSGKSVNVAQDYIIKLSDPRYKGANLLVCRKTEESNRDSTFSELQSAIIRIFGDYANSVWKITKNPMMMENLQTGSQIKFRGMADQKQREKIKSITFKTGKLTWIWLEEATEFTESDVDILDDRLRGELLNPNLFYQITFTFNPVSASHWLKAKYFDKTHPFIFTHHSTYLDNRFIDNAYHERMNLRKERDPDGFRVYGLGEWGELGGLIFSNYQVHSFPIGYDCFDSMYMGQDFGFNHANAILLLGWKDGELYICREHYVYQKDTTEIIDDCNGIFPKDVIMWCDSAEPDRIKTWRKAGYIAKPVKKTVLTEKNLAKAQGAYSYINSQINWLKTIQIHIHPSCVNTIKEIQAWKWQKCEKTNSYLDRPVDIFDDAMAALRYGVESLRKTRSSILDAVR